MGTYNSTYKSSKLAVGQKGIPVLLQSHSLPNCPIHSIGLILQPFIKLHVAMLFVVMLIQGLAVNIFFRKKMT